MKVHVDSTGSSESLKFQRFVYLETIDDVIKQWSHDLQCFRQLTRLIKAWIFHLPAVVKISGTKFFQIFYLYTYYVICTPERTYDAPMTSHDARMTSMHPHSPSHYI